MTFPPLPPSPLLLLLLFRFYPVSRFLSLFLSLALCPSSCSLPPRSAKPAPQPGEPDANR